MRLRLFVLAAIAFARPASAGAQSDTTTRVEIGAFVDLYYAHDFGRPRTLDRAFTTTAARHAEFNVNLAHVDARVTSGRLRGRLALQAGTSVQVNYAAEPHVGSASGADLARLIQEATIGYRIAPRLWIDAGVFFAPFGSESWISSDNWTYTRSLIADNSPYYQSGVRAVWTANERVTAQLHVINGWQNISEGNTDKAVATRLDWSPARRVSLTYAAFIGNEQPDATRRALRVFHELMSRLKVSERLEIAGTVDYGTQQQSATRPSAAWRGWSALARYQAAKRAVIAARFESYSDPKQIIVATGLPSGLRARGGSLNLDVEPQPGLLWRMEARGLRSPDALFPDRASAGSVSRENWTLVSSLALRINSRLEP